MAAMFWVGDMLFLSLVVGPYSQRLEVRQRSDLFTALGRGARPWAWSAMAVLVVTGLLNLTLAGIPLSAVVDPRFYSTPLGATLDLKLVAVAAMVAVALWHDSTVARRLPALHRRLAADPGDRSLVAAAAAQRRLASLLGRLALVLALVVVLLAVRLALYL